MVSAVSNRKEMDESGFLPLSVDYREKVCVHVVEHKSRYVQYVVRVLVVALLDRGVSLRQCGVSTSLGQGSPCSSSSSHKAG